MAKRQQADDGYEAYVARTEELDRRVAAGESITEILEQEKLAAMHERLRTVYGIDMDA
jgi:hypothetical protein